MTLNCPGTFHNDHSLHASVEWITFYECKSLQNVFLSLFLTAQWFLYSVVFTVNMMNSSDPGNPGAGGFLAIAKSSRKGLTRHHSLQLSLALLSSLRRINSLQFTAHPFKYNYTTKKKSFRYFFIDHVIAFARCNILKFSRAQEIKKNTPDYTSFMPIQCLQIQRMELRDFH